MGAVSDRASTNASTATRTAIPAPVPSRARRRAVTGAKASTVSSFATMAQSRSRMARGTYEARTGSPR